MNRKFFGLSGSRGPKQTNQENLVFGTRAVIESITSGREVDKLLLNKEQHNDLTKELIALARERGIPVSKVPGEKLNRITRKNHQGVIAFLSAVNFVKLSNVIASCYEQGKDPLIVILDRITDVRNFGAIARTATCAGADALVVPTRGSAQIGPDAMKTSAGALNYIPVCREDHLTSTLNELKLSGLKVAACTEKASEGIYSADLKGPVALLMGSEEDGISPDLLKLVDHQLSIPMQGEIASLNVSVATAVALFEIVRQRS